MALSMPLGAAQYTACPEGKEFVRNASVLGLQGVEPYFNAADDRLLQWSRDERRWFREEADRLHVAVPSTALGAFNGDSALIEARGREQAVGLIEHTLAFTRDVGAEVMLLCTYIQSHPDTEEKTARLLEVVRAVEPAARARGIRIALESPLPAAELKALAEAADSDHVGIYYDTGNAVALGFDPAEEIRVLGDLILSIHIKDSGDELGARRLGEGKVDLSAALGAIREVGYHGWLILETPGGDLDGLRKDAAMVRGILEQG